MLVNACYAEARRSRRSATNVRALPLDGATAADDVLTVNDRDQLERGLRRLPVDQRAVLVFHHYLGLTLPEVADRLGIPVGTAKSRLHYASAALRAALEADDRTPTLSQERPGMTTPRDPDRLSRAFLEDGLASCRTGCSIPSWARSIERDSGPCSARGGPSP